MTKQPVKKRPLKARIGLILLELGIAAVLTVTIILVLRNQIDRGRSASELADAALGAMTNADQCREAESWELKKYYGLTEDEVEEFVLRLPVSNMDAAELCVVKCASDEGAQLMLVALLLFPVYGYRGRHGQIAGMGVDVVRPNALRL